MLQQDLIRLAHTNPKLRKHLLKLFRSASTINIFHRVVAQVWTQLGIYPLMHHEGLEALWAAMFTTSPPEDLPEAVWNQIAAASRDLDQGRVLPPKKGVRLLHSFVHGDIPRIINKILHEGVRAQPQGAGKWSESPGAIFFVEGTPNKRYADSGPFIVVDLPLDWEGWAGAVGAWWDRKTDRLRDLPSHGGVVGVYSAIPAEFVVAVNGLPTNEYKKPINHRQEAPLWSK